MSVIKFPLSPLPIDRRKLLIGGAGATASLLLPSRARAQTKLTVPEGTVAALPIAIPAFAAGTPSDGQAGADVAGVITNNLRRSGLFAPIDPAAFIDRITNPDQPPQFPELEVDQCAGAGGRPRDAPRRRPAEGGIPPLGRRLPASSSPANNMSPRRNIGGASRTSSPTRSMSA